MFNTKYMFVKPTAWCCTIIAPEISSVTVVFSSYFLNSDHLVDMNWEPDTVPIVHLVSVADLVSGFPHVCAVEMGAFVVKSFLQVWILLLFVFTVVL